MADTRSIARIRIGLAADFDAADVPERGEFTYTTDTKVLKIGDGVTAYSSCVTLADIA